MGSLPMGVILCPLAVCGDICDGRRFSLCSLSSVKSCGPAAEMSAPESGKTDVTVEPFTVLMCIVILGAGSAEVTCLSADSVFEVGSMMLKCLTVNYKSFAGLKLDKFIYIFAFVCMC